MSERIDLGPVTLNRRSDHVVAVLADADMITSDIPADFEGELRRQLGAWLGVDGWLEIDLRDAPAVSSRQLGVMLTLHKVMKAKQATLPLVGLTEGVRRVLEVTRTDQFFEMPA